jgi:hypothetical protein
MEGLEKAILDGRYDLIGDSQDMRCELGLRVFVEVTGVG